jgi:branched-chain amino acid transport system substrate-binding protein
MEYVFYVYFCLCLFPILITVIGTKLDKEGYKKAFQYFNTKQEQCFALLLFLENA